MKIVFYKQDHLEFLLMLGNKVPLCYSDSYDVIVPVYKKPVHIKCKWNHICSVFIQNELKKLKSLYGDYFYLFI